LRVVEIKDGFGLDRLTLGERPEPTPEAGQVLLRMRAASLNYRDLLMVQGQYDPRQPLPLIPCSDGVGEVCAAGAGVQRVSVGERVCPIFAQGWICGPPTRERSRSTLGGPLDGTLAEWMVVDAEGVVPVPEHLGDEEAAALPCATLTAWHAVVDHGETRAGDVVVIQGTGGVSLAALQFTQLAGARAIVTSSNDDKLARATALGAWQTVNYRSKPEWAREVKRLTGGSGADLVIDVGGAGTLPQSIHAVRPGGRICSIGMVAGRGLELDVTPVFMRQVRIQGVFVGPRESFESMNRAIAQHGMRPAVSRVFPLAEARAAFEHLASAEHFGKICIRIG
jgi:NADPH:quinone reductase-like Zn-dependent oxidoreductase